MTAKTRRCHSDVNHSWEMTPKEAIALQERLRAKVILSGFDTDKVRFVAGVDLSFPGGRAVKKGFAATGIAAVVVYDIENDAVVEEAWARGEVRMPYIPGLLSFRECPLALEAFEKIRGRVDVIMVDGQGIAHPRRFGIASHLGLLLGKRSIGCAKSILVGEVQGVLKEEQGSWVKLTDKGEIVGAAVRTRTGVKPVYISPGHLTDLVSSVKLVQKMAGRYRLPEPVRQAHILAGEKKAGR
jgi:deoxyribonuclease V